MAKGIMPVAMSLEVAYSLLPSMIYEKNGRGDLCFQHMPSCTLTYCPRGVWRYWIDTTAAHIWVGNIARHL